VDPIHFPARKIRRDADWPTWLTDEERQHGHRGLYRFFSVDKTLLYVGISRSMQVRWAEHRVKAPWWTQVEFVAVSYYPPGCEMTDRVAERASVIHERPRFNKYLTKTDRKTAAALLPSVPPPAFPSAGR
jgi:hypothetical protein